MPASHALGASSRWSVALGFALFITFAGCGGDTARVCSAVDCRNGLHVMVSGNTNGETLRVEATAAGDTTPRVTQCTAFGGPCPVVFTDFFPTQVSIKVITAFDAVTYDATPTYVTSRPNGPDCEPECRSANVAVTLGLNPSPNGGVTVYKSRGVQCAPLLPLADLQAPLTQAGIAVTSTSCGIDGYVHTAVCGAEDARIGLFEIAANDVSAAQALGFATVSNLPPEARRTAC